MRTRIYTAAIVGLSTLAAGHAETINTSDRGWYDQAGSHGPANTNYSLGNGGVSMFRNFLAFDLPSAPAGMQVVGATLRTYTFAVSGAHTVTLYEYAGGIASLIGGMGGAGAFEDLGDGTVFGSRLFAASEDNIFVEYSLNSAAIAAINAALGNSFVIGGRSSHEGTPGHYAYGGSLGQGPGDGNTQLILEYGEMTVVPLPPSALLGVAGLAGIWGAGYIRQRRRA